MEAPQSFDSTRKRWGRTGGHSSDRQGEVEEGWSLVVPLSTVKSSVLEGTFQRGGGDALLRPWYSSGAISYVGTTLLCGIAARGSSTVHVANQRRNSRTKLSDPADQTSYMFIICSHFCLLHFCCNCIPPPLNFYEHIQFLTLLGNTFLTNPFNLKDLLWPAGIQHCLQTVANLVWGSTILCRKIGTYFIITLFGETFYRHVPLVCCRAGLRSCKQNLNGVKISPSK
jgi:hypothetical protein